jgi:hypothetical protein
VWRSPTGAHAYFSHAQYWTRALSVLRRPGRPLVRYKNTPAPPQYFTVANQRNKEIEWRRVELGHYLSCLTLCSPSTSFCSLLLPERPPKASSSSSSLLWAQNKRWRCKLYRKRMHMTAAACASLQTEIANRQAQIYSCGKVTASVPFT